MEVTQRHDHDVHESGLGQFGTWLYLAFFVLSIIALILAAVAWVI